MAKTLREALRQTKPYRSVEVEAFLTLRWARDRVERAAQLPLRSAELTLPQYNVLRILRGSPEGLQTQEVGDRLVAKAPNITRLVDKLERKQFLRRVRSDADRRVVTLMITEGGLRELESLEDPLDGAIIQAMSGLSASDLKTLIELLNRLGGSLAE